jgi:hypothetical protein
MENFTNPAILSSPSAHTLIYRDFKSGNAGNHSSVTGHEIVFRTGKLTAGWKKIVIVFYFIFSCFHWKIFSFVKTVLFFY